VAERDLPYEVPELEYVKLQGREAELLYQMGNNPSNW